MRAWIRILDAPGCYESAAWAERKSALQGSGLVKTVGPCAQRRVALMPRLQPSKDALSNDRRESAARFERPAKQALALATEPRPKREVRSALYHTCPLRCTRRVALMPRCRRDVHYSKMIAWIRCCVSFSLLRASVMSIRAARSSATKGPLHEPIELQATEGQLENA